MRFVEGEKEVDGEEGQGVGVQVSGVVLAGGRSRRLGVDKALLRLGGRSLIERVVDSLRELSDDILVVTNAPERFVDVLDNVRYVPDALPYSAALVGVYSGLRAARHDYALVVACDMPFLNVGLLRYLVSRAVDCDVVIPRHPQGLETLHAVYSKACLTPMERQLQADELVIVDFFRQVRVCYVEQAQLAAFDPEGRSFVNINTPADLELALRIEEAQEG